MTVVALRQRSPLPERPVAARTELSLQALVDALGTETLRPVAMPDEPGVAVRRPVIHDASASMPLEPGDLLLAVGVGAASAAARDLVLDAGRAGAAGVVFTTAQTVPPELGELGAAAGTAVLSSGAGTEWGGLHALIRSVMSCSETAGPPHLAGATDLAVGDLCGLANAVAAMVGGSIVIHDVGLRLIAYSTQDETSDQVRQDTILRRRAPGGVVDLLRRQGVLRQLREPGVVVDLDGPSYKLLGRRLAVGVHAGDEQLGSIWVLEGERPLDAGAHDALCEAARMAALHLVRHLAHDDAARRRSDILRDLLAGRAPASLASESLDLPLTAPYLVMAVQPPKEPDADHVVHTDRLVSAITAYAATYRLRTLQAADGAVVYVLVHGAEDLHLACRRLADYIISTAEPSWSPRLRVALGEAVAQLCDVPASRRLADQVLRVSAELDRPLPDVATVENVQAACILDDIRAVAQTCRHWVMPSLEAVVESDRVRGTANVSILRAYLDCGGNMRAAAGVLGLHPNTYRYRLRRLTEMTDWDLEDPDQRLVLALQLRLGLISEGLA